MSLLDELFGGTWKCWICGADQPEYRIGIAHRPIPGMEGAFPGARSNVLYCLDNPVCMVKATAPGPFQPEDRKG